MWFCTGEHTIRITPYVNICQDKVTIYKLLNNYFHTEHTMAEFMNNSKVAQAF